jgi:hypothetical protein
MSHYLHSEPIIPEKLSMGGKSNVCHEKHHKMKKDSEKKTRKLIREFNGK